MGDSSDPVVTFDDTTPPQVSATVVVLQQIMRLFDELSPREQQLLLSLINAFVQMSSDDKRVIVAAAEKMAGL